jgi:hypothetical protein
VIVITRLLSRGKFTWDPKRSSPPKVEISMKIISLKGAFLLDAVTHSDNLSYMGGKDRRIMVQGQTEQNVNKTLSPKINWELWYIL